MLPPIAAIATAPGKGGVGIVRISFGKMDKTAAQSFIEKICGRQLLPRKANYVSFIDAKGQAIDQGVALFFEAPHSYTGENILELQGHGGSMVLRLLLAACLDIGAYADMRLAEPGEFTRRAFLNNKVDLAQAEAVADLIEADTEAAVRSAQRSLSGEFSNAIYKIVTALIHLRMLIEATLDFPEEETDFLEAADVRGQLALISAQLEETLRYATQGKLLRDGLHIVLAGQPNVGKSSLLNALVGEELAIVTPIAGTTRDKIKHLIQIEGVPLHITDTAGLRDTQDEIEQIGVERSWDEIKKADMVLHLLDASHVVQQGLSEEDRVISQSFPVGTPIIRVLNKIDLIENFLETQNLLLIDADLKEKSSDEKTSHVFISVKTGEGLEALRKTILEHAGWHENGEGVYLARERHLSALKSAQAHLQNAKGHSEQKNNSLDLFAEELRLAQNDLNSITGEFNADDLLGHIFSQFCIGK